MHFQHRSPSRLDLLSVGVSGESSTIFSGTEVAFHGFGELRGFQLAPRADTR
jgi:hypothetical protein